MASINANCSANIKPLTNGHHSRIRSDPPSSTTWGYDTIQVHAGLEEDPVYGQCTLPVYDSVAFKYKSSQAIAEAFGSEGLSDAFVYSRFGNPTTAAFARRIARLEGCTDGVAVASGAGAILMTILSLARAGDNVVVSDATFGGTFHEFQIIAPAMGIQPRFCNTNNVEQVESLIDNKTRFVFSETVANPKFTVCDLEALSKITRKYRMPLVVDATFTAAGYFCQPAAFGADIIVHSATKWIGGHGTTLGGVIIECGTSEWQTNSSRFPQLHGQRPGREGFDVNLYEAAGDGAYLYFLQNDILRDMGVCLSASAAQQLCIGTESLSLRCKKQAENADALAHWLQQNPRVAWVRYLGFGNHPSHQLAQKYLKNGYGTVFTFGLKGGMDEALAVIDRLKLVINCSNVGDSKTIISHHWSTSHRQCTAEENKRLGVDEELIRVSLGIEDIQDLIADFTQALDKTEDKTTSASI
ncbi:Homocysteine synthase [Pseudocercospora fuligena]|uniref:Homocysteine synthase n=1 Tax=Pseudocercospora fuligena TaxID=685502 RepID=A0A8H6RKW9_9PEZI|nr:Homocysteine synthase [Pseudocercospora fuligena]